MISESPSIEALRAKITAYLDQNSITYDIDERGSYHFRHGTTLVFIQPIEWRNYTLVKVFAPLAVDVTRADNDLAFFLADRNLNLLFGKLSLDVGRRSIWLEHTLLGDTLDAPELILTLEFIAFVADEFDEQIAEVAGGKRAIDL